MRLFFSVALALCLSLPAFAETAGTTIRIKHGTTNLSTTVPTLVFGTITRQAVRMEVENSSLSGTLVLVTGCSTSGNRQRNVLFLNPGFSKNVPLSVGKGDCVMLYAADSAVTTGNSAFSIFFAD